MIICSSLRHIFTQAFKRANIPSYSRNIRMSVEARGDHTERTADNTRENVVVPATIVAMKNGSDTIKLLTLKVEDDSGHFTFKAGQWVDFFISGVSPYTGFSMYSAPLKLQQDHLLDLAVKYTDHPPTHWVHTKCKVGSQVELRVGGDFYYDPDPRNQSDLVLIAGGVGINPVLSIMRHVYDLQKKSANQKLGKVKLLYSAKDLQELVFKDDINQLCQSTNMTCSYFCSEENTGDSNAFQSVQYRRICLGDIEDSLRDLDKNSVSCYICGPSAMIDDMENHLKQCGLTIEQIHYEKWW